ncbi:MAG: hypothetical protein A2V66_08230 [Ignavibacteria bacterium RBG_13_36_8]|nr:MAG: hypothetical protein A2V66_08230 [Ignavibacteria bacterium RBG_13_36_8]
MTDTKEVVQVKESNRWEDAFENECWIAPVIDIYESSDDYYLTAQMPGVTKDNVKVKLEDGNLVVMGRIKYDEVKNRKYVLKETELGNFYRKFKISNSINEESIEANLENGLLNVRLPKHERVKPKAIEIK